jgi:ABC-type spermidine/putrescine transport system permease subunit II
MTLTILTVVLAVFLSGVACGVFIVLVVSIRVSERTPFLTSPGQIHQAGIGRRMLTTVRDEARPACSSPQPRREQPAWPEKSDKSLRPNDPG